MGGPASSVPGGCGNALAALRTAAPMPLWVLSVRAEQGCDQQVSPSAEILLASVFTLLHARLGKGYSGFHQDR